MKAINLATATKSEIEAALADLNGRKSSSVITTTFEIQELIKGFVARLDRDGVNIRDRAAARMWYRGAGATANAYKYARAVNKLEFQVASDGRTFLLTAIELDSAFPRENGVSCIKLSVRGHANWLVKMAKKFGVCEKAVPSAAA